MNEAPPWGFDPGFPHLDICPVCDAAVLPDSEAECVECGGEPPEPTDLDLEQAGQLTLGG